MSLRRIDDKIRKDKILAIVIDQYIKTVTPVSSGLIAQSHPLDLSSATIRNVLAELEEEGYLTHPHTSAGRIPTEKGYRYYVDNLMLEIQLLEEEKNQIKEEYRKEALQLENLLEKTSELISETTHYTGIVSLDGARNKVFYRGTNLVVNYPDYQDIKKVGNILQALEEKERILRIINQDITSKIRIFIGHELALSNIESCSLVVSRYQLRNGPSGRIAVLGPTRMNYKHVVSALEYLSRLIEKI